MAVIYGKDQYVYQADGGIKYQIVVSRDTAAIEGQPTIAGPGVNRLLVSRQGRKKGIQARRLILRRQLAAGDATKPPIFAFARPVVFSKAALDTLVAQTNVTYAGIVWQVMGADDEDNV